jgi:heterodisulfide reductase subunit B
MHAGGKKMRITYYPGCSLHSSAKEYDLSTKDVCQKIGIELEELTDWNCCGSTSAHSTNRLLSLALPARNLILAEQKQQDILTLCAACFNRMKTAQITFEKEPSIKQEVEKILGLSYPSRAKVKHFLEVLCKDIGFGEIEKLIVKPLKGLKAVAYYGCLLVRPKEIMQFDDPEHPTIMDRLIEITGAECKDWSYKTECCGGSLSITRRETVCTLVRKLISMAEEAGAQCIVTACPLCVSNLEMRADPEKKMPIFYFTEMLGLAIGVEDPNKWLNRHLVSPFELLQSINFKI